MARRRNCPAPNCIRIAVGKYCAEHNREADKARGTKEQRGYDAKFRAQRRAWRPKVESGLVNCARCDSRIHPGTPWALDHSDDRKSLLGPSHKFCNDSAGGKASHGIY